MKIWSQISLWDELIKEDSRDQRRAAAIMHSNATPLPPFSITLPPLHSPPQLPREPFQLQLKTPMDINEQTRTVLVMYAKKVPFEVCDGGSVLCWDQNNVFLRIAQLALNCCSKDSILTKGNVNVVVIHLAVVARSRHHSVCFTNNFLNDPSRTCSLRSDVILAFPLFFCWLDLEIIVIFFVLRFEVFFSLPPTIFEIPWEGL